MGTESGTESGIPELVFMLTERRRFHLSSNERSPSSYSELMMLIRMSYVYGHANQFTFGVKISLKNLS